MRVSWQSSRQWLSSMPTTLRYCDVSTQTIVNTLRNVWTCDGILKSYLHVLPGVYGCFLQLHTLVLDKLMRSQIVDSMVVVNWLFLPQTVSDFHKYASSTLNTCITPSLRWAFYRQYIWDVLESTVQKTNSAYYTASKELAETKEKLTKVGLCVVGTCGYAVTALL